MNQLNQVTQQNAASSEQLAATSEEMSGQAAQLQELMSFFVVNDTPGTKHSKPQVRKIPLQATKSHSTGSHAFNEDEFVHF